MQTVILAIGLLIFFSYAAAGIFARTRIPDVLPLTLLGIVMGPVLGWIHPSDYGGVGLVMSMVALIVLLFEGGTALNLRTLVWSMRSALGLSVAAYVAAAAAVALLSSLFLGLRPMSAAIFGLVCGGTSSAVVIPIVRRLHIRESTKTILIMESAITDVLCIVAVYALVFGVHAGTVSPGRLVGAAIASMGMAIVIGLAGALAWLSLVTGGHHHLGDGAQGTRGGGPGLSPAAGRDRRERDHSRPDLPCRTYQHPSHCHHATVY